MIAELKIDANNIAPSIMVAWLKRGKHRANTDVAEQHRTMRQGLDQQLRRSIRPRPGLRKLEAVVNRLVSPLGLGDTLVAWFQKP